MTVAEFQSFVESHADLFVGLYPHADLELDSFEVALGNRLPESLRWLLGTHGYSECCGVSNLQEAVKQTLDCRRSISLPSNWLILNDWGDAGIVLLDMPTGRICWCGIHAAGNLGSGKIDSDTDWFDGFPEWVSSRVACLD